MSDPDWNTMNPEQKLETLYQLFHALFIEAGELETRVSRFTSGTDVPTIEVEPVKEGVSKLEGHGAKPLH
jgi:hypothetical protein